MPDRALVAIVAAVIVALMPMVVVVPMMATGLPAPDNLHYFGRNRSWAKLEQQTAAGR
jgi:hypothetical protein